MIRTGNARVDRFQTPLQLGAAEGYRWVIEARKITTPDGRRVNGWCDTKARLLHIYPSPTLTDNGLRKLLHHEAGHAHFFNRSYPHRWWRKARGLTDASRYTQRDVAEDHAEVVAWGRLTAEQRQNLGFLFANRTRPTAAQIAAAVS